MSITPSSHRLIHQKKPFNKKLTIQYIWFYSSKNHLLYTNPFITMAPAHDYIKSSKVRPKWHPLRCRLWLIPNTGCAQNSYKILFATNTVLFWSSQICVIDKQSVVHNWAIQRAWLNHHMCYNLFKIRLQQVIYEDLHLNLSNFHNLTIGRT